VSEHPGSWYNLSMNLFFLSRDPSICAQQHCDKHVVKMILEYAQLLSTAHRLLDGKPQTFDFDLPNGKVKRLTHWALPGETVTPMLMEGKPFLTIGNSQAYKVAHQHHPLSFWSRESSGNYQYLFELFVNCLAEYTHRYGKKHSAEALLNTLSNWPLNIRFAEFVDPPLSMPDEYRTDDAVISYQNLYVGSKARFAKWTNRRPPEWFIQRTPNYDQTHFERTR